MHLSLSLSLGSTMGGVGRPVNPITILGDDLLAWWTADDASSMTLVGSAVSAWRDQKNGYEVAQATGAARPQYSATSFNGSPSLTFDGTDDRLTANDVWNFPVGANASEVWSIIQQDALAADTTNRSVFMYGGTTNLNAVRNMGRGVVSAQNRGRIVVGTGTGTTATNDATTALNGRHLIRAQYYATSSDVTVDGTGGNTVAVVPGTDSLRTRIGSNTLEAPGQFWHGKIRDVVIATQITTDQAAALRDWMLPRRML